MERSTSRTAWSLRQRLALGLVLATLVPVLLFAGLLLQNQWQSSRDTLSLQLDANARLSAGVIEDSLDAHLAALALLSDQVQGAAGADAERLSRLLHAYPALLRIRLVDADGRVLLARDGRGRQLAAQVPDVSAAPWFREVRERLRPVVSGVMRQPEYGDEAVVTLVVPVLRGEHFRGALQAAIPAESLVRRPQQSLDERGLALLLLDADGRVIDASPALHLSVLDTIGRVGAQLRALATSSDRPGRVGRVSGLLPDSASPAFVRAIAMREGWTLVLAAPGEVVWMQLRPRLWLVLALLAATLVGTGVAIWRQRQMLRDGIGYLTSSLRGYALGGQVEAVSDRLPRELHPLAEGIAELATRLNAAYADLRQALESREREIALRTDSLRRAVEELDRLSRTDALTGSLNYRGFVEAGQRLWDEAQASGKPLSVLALDIDYFKRYNDLYGHAAGDNALRRFAGAVRSALLHAGDVLARPGGEEFTVFLPNTTHAQAMRVAERVRRRVHEADIIHAGAPKGRLTVSIGVATRQPLDLELEDLLKRADAALYRAKDAGRDGFSD